MSEMGLKHSTDVFEADWVRERLHPHEFRIASVAPDGFTAYCRVLHPVEDGRGGVVRWGDVARWSGRTMHPLVQFHAIARGPGDAAWDGEPDSGNLERQRFARLCSILAEHTTTPERCWFCLWTGFGQLNGGLWIHTLVPRDSGVTPPPAFQVPALQELDGPQVEMPMGREYLLFQGSLSAAAILPDPFGGRDLPEPHGRSESAQSPNLFWPQDRAWCVATEIDLFDTLVAGSEALVESLEVDPLLETLRVKATDPVDYDSDRVNA